MMQGFRGMHYGFMGYGYVGRATYDIIARSEEGHYGTIHDIAHEDSTRELLTECNVVFVCIPTVTDKDIDNVIFEIKELKKLNPYNTIVVRCTLPLGSCDRIQKETGEKIIYWPEFLREQHFDEDKVKRPWIIGHDGVSLPEFITKDDYIEVSTKEAELIKMFSNNLGTMRVAFANVFYDLAGKVGADYNKVKDAYLQVQQNQSYLDVPGYDGKLGFGGKCLPKDLDFLIDTLDQNDVDSMMFKAVRELNEEWRNAE
jgi:UDPglucose 6-dehydrogenase